MSSKTLNDETKTLTSHVRLCMALHGLETHSNRTLFHGCALAALWGSQGCTAGVTRSAWQFSMD